MKQRSTIEWVVFTISTIGYFFVYMAKGVYWVYRAWTTAMAITAESIAEVVVEHPVLSVLSWTVVVIACVTICVLCCKGLRRIILTLLILVLATLITAAVTYGLVLMWNGVHDTSPG